MENLAKEKQAAIEREEKLKLFVAKKAEREAEEAAARKKEEELAAERLKELAEQREAKARELEEKAKIRAEEEAKKAAIAAAEEEARLLEAHEASLQKDLATLSILDQELELLRKEREKDEQRHIKIRTEHDEVVTAIHKTREELKAAREAEEQEERRLKGELDENQGKIILHNPLNRTGSMRIVIDKA